MDTHIQKVSDDLSLITLSPPIYGFTSFISAWLYHSDIACLVDVGPSSTAQQLLHALQAINLGRLDYILLTHIHLDHAGAIGQIAARFPHTPIVCHPAGIPHLVNPARLWESTQKVLGKMAEGYGPLQPVALQRFVSAEQCISAAFVPILTPGHASHHVSYWTKRYLFAGEAAGVYYSIDQNRFYTRPATPPRFFLDTQMESIAKLIAYEPATLCYAHYGLADDGTKRLENHRDQLCLWQKIISDEIKGAYSENLIEACLQKLFQQDPLIKYFHELPQDTQARETYFLKNSITGFIGCLNAD